MRRSHRLPNPATSASSSSSIGFRLDEESHQALAQRAALLKVSPHQLAREYVLTGLLETEEHEALHEELTTLRSEVLELHQHLRLGVQALLYAAGEMTKDDARAYVQENFK